MMLAAKAFFGKGNFVILAVLVITAGLVSEHFWTGENIVNVIRAASLIGIVAIGMNVVIIGGGIDLSVGSIVALTGAVADPDDRRPGSGACLYRWAACLCRLPGFFDVPVTRNIVGTAGAVRPVFSGRACDLVHHAVARLWS